jgi:hypothetical protein
MGVKKASKTEKAYINAVANLSCALCGDRPVEVHHIREGQGMSQRASHYLTIPLCHRCHRQENGIHGDRTLLRIYKKTELDLLAETIERLFNGSNFSN